MQRYKNAMIIKHGIIEFSGITEDILKEMDILYEIVELEKGEKIPKEVENLDFVFSLGGSMTVYQEKIYPFLKEEIEFIKKLYKIKIHFLGIPKIFSYYQYHNDCFEIPKEGILLIKDREGNNQGFKIGKNLYSFQQFHIEFDEELIFNLTKEKNIKKINEVREMVKKQLEIFKFKKEGNDE